MLSNTAKLGEWRIFENAEAVAEHAAEWLCLLACACDREFSICLSGESTPRRLYQQPAGDRIASRFPWDRGAWFWGDERFVPHANPDSNTASFTRAFFTRSGAHGSHPCNRDRGINSGASRSQLSNYATLLR